MEIKYVFKSEVLYLHEELLDLHVVNDSAIPPGTFSIACKQNNRQKRRATRRLVMA
jgi:hypothetical protein